MSSSLKDDLKFKILLESCGLDFGMVYQIVDDCIDGDPNAINNINLENAKEFAAKAVENIENLESSV